METKIIDLCNKLHKTYDASILKNFPSEYIKELFLLTAKKYKDGKKGNLALMNIIYNTFYGVLPSPKFISGPMSISYQTSSVYEKYIYIFGEYHGTINRCDYFEKAQYNFMNISEYLENFFSNTDKFIDFYLEDELFRTIKPNRYFDFVNMLRYDLDNCLNKEKRYKCKYKNVRTHFIDSRTIQKEDYLVSTNKIGHLITDLKVPYFVHSHYHTIEELSKLNTYEKISEYILKLVVTIPIIKKEIDRSDLGEFLIIKNFRPVLINSYKRRINIQLWNSIDWTNWTEIKRNAALLIALESHIQDVYAIARMFKTFKKTKYLPSKPTHIIYYAGDSHADIIRDFLNSLSFDQHLYRKMDVDSWTRCLHLGDDIKIDFQKKFENKK